MYLFCITVYLLYICTIINQTSITMYSLLLSEEGSWGPVVLVIGGFFLFVYLAVTIYSKIDEKTNIEERSNGCGWPLFILAFMIIIGLIANAKSCKCSANHDGDYFDSVEYQHLRE